MWAPCPSRSPALPLAGPSPAPGSAGGQSAPQAHCRASCLSQRDPHVQPDPLAAKAGGPRNGRHSASCQQTRKETHVPQGVREAPVSPRDRGGNTEAQGNGSGLGLFGLLLQVTLSSLWQHSIDAWLQGDLRACGCSWGPADSGHVAVQWAGLWGSRCTGGQQGGGTSRVKTIPAHLWRSGGAGS